MPVATENKLLHETYTTVSTLADDVRENTAICQWEHRRELRERNFRFALYAASATVRRTPSRCRTTGIEQAMSRVARMHGE